MKRQLFGDHKRFPYIRLPLSSSSFSSLGGVSGTNTSCLCFTGKDFGQVPRYRIYLPKRSNSLVYLSVNKIPTRKFPINSALSPVNEKKKRNDVCKHSIKVPYLRYGISKLQRSNT